MFQTRFTKRAEEEKAIRQNPNRRYFVGCWKTNTCRIKASILKTDGQTEWFWQKGKYKVIVTQANYLVYALELSRKGRVYKKRYIYQK